MAVPEATAHINDRFVFSQDNVRTPRQRPDMLVARISEYFLTCAETEGLIH